MWLPPGFTVYFTCPLLNWGGKLQNININCKSPLNLSSQTNKLTSWKFDKPTNLQAKLGFHFLCEFKHVWMKSQISAPSPSINAIWSEQETLRIYSWARGGLNFGKSVMTGVTGVPSQKAFPSEKRMQKKQSSNLISDPRRKYWYLEKWSIGCPFKYVTNLYWWTQRLKVFTIRYTLYRHVLCFRRFVIVKKWPSE